MMGLVRQVHQQVYEDFTLGALKLSIILVALLLIVAAATIDNKWVLAGIFAYEVLP